MKAEARKLAIADYKKRPSVAGIFAIRCAATAEVWVGQTLDLDKIQNRIWFSLRMGNHKNAEAVEKLKDEELPYVRDALLKERLAHWRATLNAQPV